MPVEVWLLVLCAAAVMAVLGSLPEEGSGERRCSECWYDLSRVEGVRCPECDHAERKPLDRYPTRRRWWLVMGAGLVATPALAACYEAMIRDMEWRGTLVSMEPVLRGLGLLMMVGAMWLLVRTARRWARAWARGRVSPPQWKAVAVLAVLLGMHGLCVWMLPAAAVHRWGVVPQVIRQLFVK